MFVIYPLFLRCKEGYQGVRCDQFLPKTDSILSDPSTSNVFLIFLIHAGGCFCHARWPFAYCQLARDHCSCVRSAGLPLLVGHGHLLPSLFSQNMCCCSRAGRQWTRFLRVWSNPVADKNTKRFSASDLRTNEPMWFKGQPSTGCRAVPSNGNELSLSGAAEVISSSEERDVKTGGLCTSSSEVALCLQSKGVISGRDGETDSLSLRSVYAQLPPANTSSYPTTVLLQSCWLIDLCQKYNRSWFTGSESIY